MASEAPVGFKDLIPDSKKMLKPSDTIFKLMEATYPGPNPSFSPYHIVKALLTVGRKRVLGRKLLADDLGLGTGAVRTLIQRLSIAGLLFATPSGCRLTPRGTKLYSKLAGSILIHPVDPGRLRVDKCSVAILVRGAARRVKKGLEERDAAVRAGATGAITLIYEAGKFSIPQDSVDCENDFPDPVWKKMVDLFVPRSGDLFIICGAPTYEVAERGAIAASMNIISL